MPESILLFPVILAEMLVLPTPKSRSKLLMLPLKILKEPAPHSIFVSFKILTFFNIVLPASSSKESSWEFNSVISILPAPFSIETSSKT